MHPLVWVRSRSGAKAPGSSEPKPLFLQMTAAPDEYDRTANPFSTTIVPITSALKNSSFSIRVFVTVFKVAEILLYSII
jgi:hypothetical protein